jgi:hypothetical protein
MRAAEGGAESPVHIDGGGDGAVDQRPCERATAMMRRRRTCRRGGRGRGKSLRSSAHSGLCDAKSDAFPENFFSSRSSLRIARRCRRQVRASTFLLVVARTPVERKGAFSRCFFHACVASPRTVPARRRRYRRADRSPSPSSPDSGAEKSCAKVLTPRKTVIRFRPKQSMLRKRVSRINTTARETTQSIVTRIGVDAGLASPAETQRPLSMTPASPGDAGVFLFVGSRVSHARPLGNPYRRACRGSGCRRVRSPRRFLQLGLPSGRCAVARRKTP